MFLRNNILWFGVTFYTLEVVFLYVLIPVYSKKVTSKFCPIKKDQYVIWNEEKQHEFLKILRDFISDKNIEITTAVV